MDTDKLFQRARALVNKPKPKTISNRIAIIYTPELLEYIGADINTPMGIGRIVGVSYSHTRRVQAKTYKLYTLIIDIVDKQYRITTYEHTQWTINV